MRISMKKYVVVFGVLLALFMAACTSQEMNKAEVQNAMQSFIYDKLAAQDGNYYIDGIQAEYQEIHEKVKEKEGLYKSCVDFKADDDLYDIDFYVKKEGNKYTVVKEVFHKKNGEAVNKVLWEK